MVKIKIFDPRFGGRNVTLNRDGQSARDIYKYYIEEENRPADQILPRNAQWDKKKKKIKFFKSKLWGPAPSPYAQVFHYQNIITDPVHNLYSVIESYRGQTIELTMVDFNGVKHNKTITIPQTGFRKIWNGLYWWLGLYSEQGYWDPNNNEQFNPDTQTQLVISIKDKVNPVQIHQAFLDGTTHCLFTPICDWVDERLKNLEPGSRRTKFITKYNWLHDSRKLRGGFLGKYKDGVPDNPEDLQFISDKLEANLEISIPSYLVNKSCVIHKYRAKTQGHSKSFKFLNIRLNHIELNELMNTGDVITLKPEELFKLKKEFDEKDTYYGWYDNNNIIHKLVTLSHTYQSSSDYKDVMDEFGEENNLDRYYIHHLEHQKLSDFILENQNTNHAINFLNPGPDVEDKIIEKTWNVEKGRWDEDPGSSDARRINKLNEEFKKLEDAAQELQNVNEWFEAKRIAQQSKGEEGYYARSRKTGDILNSLLIGKNLTDAQGAEFEKLSEGDLDFLIKKYQMQSRGTKSAGALLREAHGVFKDITRELIEKGIVDPVEQRAFISKMYLEDSLMAKIESLKKKKKKTALDDTEIKKLEEDLAKVQAVLGVQHVLYKRLLAKRFSIEKKLAKIYAKQLGTDFRVTNLDDYTGEIYKRDEVEVNRDRIKELESKKKERELVVQ